ncbi:MAG: TerB family tellurite resistance protein [Campylobacteraceae bacterium]|nr:TerB family tellurite resistance protein [Campylobacteraceae bacterium]
MKILVLLIVGFILYLIARSYKTEKYVNINFDIKDRFDGDLMHHEAGLLVALMSKVAKADGKVSELEAEVLKHTFSDISSHFENNEEIREKLKEIYTNEKESFDNTIVIAQKLYKLTSRSYEKRMQVLEYLVNLAFIDQDFSKAEQMIIEDIAQALQISSNDYNNIINKFKSFYANVAASSKTTLEDAYKVLGASSSDDDKTIKLAYRTLVRKHHPDIISGQGAAQNIIDEATKKLQEINEAYEMIKKSRK